jgi:hypothetical protein
MFFHNLSGIILVILDSLDYPIKGQGMYNLKTTENLQILKEGKYLDQEKNRRNQVEVIEFHLIVTFVVSIIAS